MSELIKVGKLKQTILACPFLMEGTDSEGNELYIRERHGTITVRHKDYGNVVFEVEGHLMTLDHVIHATDSILDWSDCGLEMIDATSMFDDYLDPNYTPSWAMRGTASIDQVADDFNLAVDLAREEIESGKGWASHVLGEENET